MNLSKDFPMIVCLCGSTRFVDDFRLWNFNETLAGRIVLTIGCDMKSDDDLFRSLSDQQRFDVKNRLDALHLRKIDLCDEVLCLNIGGYIGESTAREVAYALQTGKPVRYVEPYSLATEIVKAMIEAEKENTRRAIKPEYMCVLRTHTTHIIGKCYNEARDVIRDTRDGYQILFERWMTGDGHRQWRALPATLLLKEGQ